MEDAIKYILVDMDEYLTANQSQKLQRVLVSRLTKETRSINGISNDNYLSMFLNAKKIEGCSERTLAYYKTTVEKLLDEVDDPIRKVTTDDIREYLANYQGLNDCSKTTIDNIRRNISSFFTWLEEEDYIIKSPMRRIHKIKTTKTVKEVISDEEIEKMRDKCKNLRDLAIIDLLYSTGIRIGELVRLNIDDIDFEERECIVFGKGDKERRVYFDAKTKIHLMSYINSRFDTNPALFVTLDAPYNRLQISGVEIRLRRLGRELGINKVHPHKFRRTMATRAIDKGMPIEQVQKLLGHSQIDTTMRYAIVNQTNVKVAHRKFIA
ncbi:integrase [Candidatus Nanosynbacter lyticus]|uniref:Integrase n=1 Tax=Candidatus Nanosynbacter lyticus TaxID=2093824 RepID=A0A6S4GQR5_9BACT|nr:site-specific tyrosine recombinase/integron integrase [Candidatus Nanosynbacter lyticus]AJA06443.1 integrase [Candidatus Nanosynbacter lyticus]QCT41491.1 integrase [TM7 phylum sp. oral taxon 952]